MKTRIIETKFWKDPYIITLTVEERLLYLYFLTNERVNIIQCYEITDREISFDTGLQGGLIGASKKKFAVDKKIAFSKNYVYLLNAYRYENYTGELAIKGKIKLLNQLPKDILEWYKTITPLQGGLKGTITINNKQEAISKDIVARTAELKNRAHAIIGNKRK